VWGGGGVSDAASVFSWKQAGPKKLKKVLFETLKMQKNLKTIGAYKESTVLK
jgi:hypothetical protein